MNIRTVVPGDAERISEIYRPYVENTAITFEYDAPGADEIRSRILHTLDKYPYLAAEEDGVVMGYAYVGPFKERKAYDWSVEVSIYVDGKHHGRGIGSGLYRELEWILAKQNIINLNACIAFPEKEDEYLTGDSVRFHEKMGYTMVGKFHKCGYKFGKWYNMVWMEKMLGIHPVKPSEIIPFGKLDYV